MGKKTIIILTVTVLLIADCYSQKIMVGGRESNGRLAWPDFIGKIDQNSSFNAYTHYNLRTNINRIQVLGDSVLIEGFEVTVELDQSRSWAKPDRLSDKLLEHEQGHFNLGILCMREMLEKYKQTRLTKDNYNTQLRNMLDEISKKYKDLGIKYDAETDHSKNPEQRLKWNNFFTEQLKDK